MAQESIEFLSPSDSARSPTSFSQEVTVQWIDGAYPVRGDITLSTTLGSVAHETVRTDDFGHATFIVVSKEAGVTMLEATAGSISSRIRVQFETPGPGNGLNDRIAVQPPFGANGSLRRDEHETRYWLANDRIAFVAGDGYKRSDLDDFVNDNDVVEIIVLDETMFALRFNDDTRTTPLRNLVRELEDIGGTGLLDTERPIRKAGLVAWLDGTTQAYIALDTIIVKFRVLPSTADKVAFENQYKLNDLEQLGRNPRRFVATIDISQTMDPISLATEIDRDPLVELVDSSFVVARSSRSSVDTTPGFNLQWYHENVGDYAQEDADIDSESAWAFTEGSHNVMIAVLDSGFDIFHPDLIDNLDPVDPTNFAEDFFDNDNTDLLGSSFGMEAFGHGTRAAGVAAARGDNNKGYAGVCPSCQLLLIRIIHDDDTAVTGIDEAVTRGAKVISNSWGWPVPGDNLVDAMNDAVEDGVTIFMAMTNEEIDNCSTIGPFDTSSLDTVIAVSGVTDYDRRSPNAWEGLGYGACMDIVAPTRGGEKGIHTTSVEMTPSGKLATYWHDFSGTSAATPMAAGVAGLLLTVDNSLTPLQLQSVLQDTADRVHSNNAEYSALSGFSDPGGEPKYGYGRINAFEAVRLVATALPPGDEPSGRGGKDLLLRDHAHDWGNTEQPSNTLFTSPRQHYIANKSVDIKIDIAPFVANVETAGAFEAFKSELTNPGVLARVYVRTRNRGPNTVTSSTLKLHATVVQGSLPDLPTDFWTSFPADSSLSTVWQTIGSDLLTNIAYSGASIAGCPERLVPKCHLSPAQNDPAVIRTFDLPAMDWDSDNGQYLALLVAIDSDEDPLQGKLTPSASFNNVMTAVHMDNNVTLWVSKQPAGGGLNIPDYWLIALVVLAVAMGF